MSFIPSKIKNNISQPTEAGYFCYLSTSPLSKREIKARTQKMLKHFSRLASLLLRRGLKTYVGKTTLGGNSSVWVAPFLGIRRALTFLFSWSVISLDFSLEQPRIAPQVGYIKRFFNAARVLMPLVFVPLGIFPRTTARLLKCHLSGFLLSLRDQRTNPIPKTRPYSGQKPLSPECISVGSLTFFLVDHVRRLKSQNRTNVWGRSAVASAVLTTTSPEQLLIRTLVAF